MRIILHMPEDEDWADLILQMRAARSLATEYPESRDIIISYESGRTYYAKRNGNRSITVRPA